MNKQKGNMFGFITHTWNAIKGRCIHNCKYCYMKRFPQDDIRLDQNALKDDLGSGNYIFVGSSTDMFGNDVPREWILSVIEHIKKFPKNKYLFQTKNPIQYMDYQFPENVILSTTIETTNMKYIQSFCYNPPSITSRIIGMASKNHPKMLTIEPVMDFDIHNMFRAINKINPLQINIGADSGSNKLPEPNKKKLEEFIHILKESKKYQIHLKDNLGRLLK
jgi:DNA repair photolyase